MNNEVKTIMTKKIHTLSMGRTVLEAKIMMAELRIRHLPIVDEMGDIVGLISARDLKNLKDPQLPIEFLMSTPVESIDESDSLRSAVLRILELKISCLLIANKDGDAVGIMTTDDLLWHLADLLKTDNTLSGLLSKETIGDVANKLALMGI